MLSAVVLGGGVAGIGTALELAEKGYKVTILEKRESCLAGSSDNTPCRLGLGFHYPDLETAKRYLYASLSVLKKYKNFVVAKDEDQSHPLRRGRYFITQDSHFSASKILALYEQLREEYKSAIEKDPSNKVLGDPEDFFKELPIDAYSDKVNLSKVKIGIETAEQILDWPSLKQHLLDEVKNNPNITTVTEAEVSMVENHADDFGYKVKYKQKGSDELQTIDTNYIINATWEGMELIASKSGIPVPENAVTTRLKCLIKIKLPEDYDKEGQESNSMFFCFGPHASLNNVGKRNAYLCYEPVTNVAQSNEMTITPLMHRFLYGTPSQKEMDEHGDGILKGAIEYMPKLKGAVILAKKYGIVKTMGNADIFSKESDFHCRNYSGVEEKQLGWIDNASMKLLYFIGNAEECSDYLLKHEKTLKIFNEILSQLKNDLSQVDFSIDNVFPNIKNTLENCISTNLDKTLPQLENALTQNGLSIEERLQSIRKILKKCIPNAKPLKPEHQAENHPASASSSQASSSASSSSSSPSFGSQQIANSIQSESDSSKNNTPKTQNDANKSEYLTADPMIIIQINPAIDSSQVSQEKATSSREWYKPGCSPLPHASLSLFTQKLAARERDRSQSDNHVTLLSTHHQ